MVLKYGSKIEIYFFAVCLRNETYCTITSEQTSKLKWDLFSAVCLERLPVIAKPMTDIEKKFQECLNEIDVERSHKSNHELRVEKEKAAPKGLLGDSEDTKLKLQTVGDYEEACELELQSFKFAPTITGTHFIYFVSKLRGSTPQLICKNFHNFQIHRYNFY